MDKSAEISIMADDASNFEDLLANLRKTSTGAPSEVRELVKKIVDHPVVEQLRPTNAPAAVAAIQQQHQQRQRVVRAQPTNVNIVNHLLHDAATCLPKAVNINQEMTRLFTPTGGFRTSRRGKRTQAAAAAGSAMLAATSAQKTAKPKKVRKITRDVVLLDVGMTSKPTDKQELYNAGRIANCVTFTSDMTADEVCGVVMSIFGNKLEHLPNPRFHFVKAERNKIFIPKLPPGTIYDGETIFNLCGQGVINIMASGIIGDTFDPKQYQEAECSGSDVDDETSPQVVFSVKKAQLPELAETKDKPVVQLEEIDIPDIQPVLNPRRVRSNNLVHVHVPINAPETAKHFLSGFEVDFMGEQHEDDAEEETPEEPIVKKTVHGLPHDAEGGAEGNDVEEILKSHCKKLTLSKKAKMLYIRRSRPFESLMREIRRSGVSESDSFEIKFKDSLSTVDDTGPRRDFLRRCLLDIRDTSGLFVSVSEAGAYTITHNAVKLDKNEYYCAGRAIAMSLVFGGPAPNFLTESLFDFITKGYDDVQPAIREVLPVKLRELLWQLLAFTDESKMHEFVFEELSTLMTEAGILKWTFPCSDSALVVKKLTKYLVIGRCRSELEEFLEGLSSYGVLSLVRQHPAAFKEIFCLPTKPKTLTADGIIQMFTPEFSEQGSLRREEEENLHDMWIEFVREVGEGKIKLLDLEGIHRFLTGLDNQPPLGWGEAFPSILFDHSPKSKYIQSRTCGPTLLLPVSKYASYDEFKEVAVDSIVSSPSILAD